MNEALKATLGTLLQKNYEVTFCAAPLNGIILFALYGSLGFGEKSLPVF